MGFIISGLSYNKSQERSKNATHRSLTIMNISMVLKVCCFTWLFFFILVKPSFAYLDPGTSSMIIQVIVSVFVGAAVAIKVYWYKLKSFFRKDKKENKVER